MAGGLARHWSELRSDEIAALDHDRCVAVLALGAIEQHGPHLPLGVDQVIVEGVLAAAMGCLPDGVTCVALPGCAVGKSDEHAAFPGTLTLSAETLARQWTEIGRSVARAGLRRLILLNGHGGQVAIGQITARALRIEAGMLAVPVIWPQLGLPPGLVSDDEQRFGIHGGQVETAVMLALRPDLVRMDRAADFVPLTQRLAGELPILMGLGAAGFGWQAHDLHPSGACGNAGTATAALGTAILEHAGARLAALIGEVARFPLHAFEPPSA